MESEEWRVGGEHRFLRERELEYSKNLNPIMHFSLLHFYDFLIYCHALKTTRGGNQNIVII